MRETTITGDAKQFKNTKQEEKKLIHLMQEYFKLDKCTKSVQYARNRSLEQRNHVLAIERKQHQNILANLGRAEDPGTSHDNNTILEKLEMLTFEHSTYKHKIQQCKLYITEIEYETKQLGKKVSLLGKQQVTDRQCDDRKFAAVKSVEQLENQLETQYRKFGAIYRKNRELKEQINHLLWERGNFLTCWNKFLDKLTAGKKIMVDLIEQATLAYNRREDWCNQLQFLRMKAHHDLMKNMEIMRNKQLEVDAHTKLADFVSVTSQKRLMLDLKQKYLIERLKRTAEYKRKVQKYRFHLSSIKDFCKMSNFNLIGLNFTQQEERNLSNFKFIVDEMCEAENSAGRLGQLHFEIDQKNALLETRKHQQRLTTQALEDDLVQACKSTTEKTQNLKDGDSKLIKLLEGVTELFELCKCDKDPLLHLLGDNRKIKFYNVALYLEILLKKVQEMLIMGYLCDDARRKFQCQAAVKSIIPRKTAKKIYAIDEIVTATLCSFCAEKLVVSETIHYVQAVLTRDQVKSKLKIWGNLPNANTQIHTILHCDLPQARQIAQKKYL